MVSRQLETMKKLITCILLAFTLNAAAITLGWAFNRSTNRFTFSFQPVAGRHYSLVRKDLVSGYYDMPFNVVATNNNPIQFEIDPMIAGDELINPDLNPSPSGQFWFYLVEQQ